jgi:hypothetical protein
MSSGEASGRPASRWKRVAAAGISPVERTVFPDGLGVLFEQHDPRPALRRRERRNHAARPRPDDYHVRSSSSNPDFLLASCSRTPTLSANMVLAGAG